MKQDYTWGKLVKHIDADSVGREHFKPVQVEKTRSFEVPAVPPFTGRWRAPPTYDQSGAESPKT